MKKEAKVLVGDITDYLNSFSTKQYTEEFINEMSVEHRTLQQNFTRLCLSWLEHCASDNYRFDGRNEGSHKVSKQLIEPFIEKNGGYDFNKPSNYLSHV